MNVLSGAYSEHVLQGYSLSHLAKWELGFVKGK